MKRRCDVRIEPWCVWVCDGVPSSASRAFAVRYCHIQMCVYVMCFNIRLPQCNQNTSVWRWIRWIGVFEENVVFGEKCGVCVCASSRLAYFLFLTTWETASQGRQTTSHIRGILISCLSLFTSHPHVPSAFPFRCFSSPFASFCTLFCFAFLISHFHSLPLSCWFCPNC